MWVEIVAEAASGLSQERSATHVNGLPGHVARARTALPLAPPLPSIASAAAEAALFDDFAGTMGRSDFPWTCIIGLRVRPFRCGPPGRELSSGQPEDIPVPLQVACMRARGLRPRRVGAALAMARRPMLPSAFLHSVGALDHTTFRGSILCPHVPLSTLRRRPCERLRMTRGRRGWLGLQRTELPSATTCRFSRRTENVGSQFLSLRQALTEIKQCRRGPRPTGFS